MSGSRSFLFLREFHCRGCHGQEAYPSRTRSAVEEALLRCVMLKPVRCARCFHRSYIFRMIPTLTRAIPARGSRPPGDSSTGSRVA